jgi:hypothetical protein
MSDGGVTTSFATAFPSAAAARASERRVLGTVLATPGATTGLNAELENAPGGRIAIAVEPDGTLRIIVIAARGARLVGTVTTKPGAPAPDLTPHVAGLDQAISRIAPVVGASTVELGVSDAMRLAIRAAWVASGRTGAEIAGSMLAATVDGTPWVMADMGVPGTPDVRLFRALSPTAYQMMGQVAFSGTCPAIPVSLRQGWGYASECAPDDVGQPLPGSQPLAPGVLPEPVQGNGQWIWMMSRSGSINSIIARARATGLRTLYIFGLLGLAACTFAYAVIPSPELLITARGLCGVGFSSTLLASVMAVRSMVPLELQATGQALLGAVSFGLAVSIASLVGGVIYAQFGAEALFYLATIILLSAIPFAARILRNA